MTKSRGILAKRIPWTASDDTMIRELYPDTPTKALAAAMGRSLATVYGRAKHLNVEKSEAFRASEASGRLRGQHGAATRFQKGQPARNKGLRRPGYSQGRGRMQETQFKKGERRGVAVRLYVPIGTERVTLDGYRSRKVNDEMPLQRRWRFVHVLMWEEANGPMPPGHAITFVNGDRTDLRLENLACISRAALGRRNNIWNRYPKELADTVQLMGALTRKINRRSGREEQNRQSA